MIARHLSGKANASRFSLAEAELRSVLSSRAAVGSPVVRSVESSDGIRYIREFDAGRVIGTDRFNGNQATSVMTIMTDRFGILKLGSKPEWSVIPGPNVTTRLYGPAPTELAPATCIVCVIRNP